MFCEQGQADRCCGLHDRSAVGQREPPSGHETAQRVLDLRAPPLAAKGRVEDIGGPLTTVCNRQFDGCRATGPEPFGQRC